MTETITTYYCDRCGEKMVKSPVFFCSTHPDTTIQILLGGEWKYADLCDKCKESFRAWWKNLPQARQWQKGARNEASSN